MYPIIQGMHRTPRHLHWVYVASDLKIKPMGLTIPAKLLQVIGIIPCGTRPKPCEQEAPCLLSSTLYRGIETGKPSQNYCNRCLLLGTIHIQARHLNVPKERSQPETSPVYFPPDCASSAVPPTVKIPIRTVPNSLCWLQSEVIKDWFRCIFALWPPTGGGQGVRNRTIPQSGRARGHSWRNESICNGMTSVNSSLKHEGSKLLPLSELGNGFTNITDWPAGNQTSFNGVSIVLGKVMGLHSVFLHLSPCPFSLPSSHLLLPCSSNVEHVWII